MAQSALYANWEENGNVVFNIGNENDRSAPWGTLKSQASEFQLCADRKKIQDIRLALNGISFIITERETEKDGFKSRIRRINNF